MNERPTVRVVRILRIAPGEGQPMNIFRSHDTYFEMTSISPSSPIENSIIEKHIHSLSRSIAFGFGFLFGGWTQQLVPIRLSLVTRAWNAMPLSFGLLIFID